MPSHFCQAFVAILLRLSAILTDMSALVFRTPQETLFTDHLMESVDWKSPAAIGTAGIIHFWKSKLNTFLAVCLCNEENH